MNLIATQMNDVRTHSTVQAAVPQPEWGDISTDRLGYYGAERMIAKHYLTGVLMTPRMSTLSNR